MKRTLGICRIIIISIFILSSCDLIPSDFTFGVNANINTTSEIGQETLDRVDAVNDTLASGLEVGPETRATIEELNDTIANGVKAGFDEETLARVDELLRVVEDGLKIGLDDDTLNSVNGMVDAIDAMPGNWETSAQDIIQTLENTAGSTAKTLANEIKGVMDDAKLNYQQMTAITGIEFRCNVDFMGSKVGATAQEFIGKSIVGKLKNILKGTKQTETVPVPWVCQVIPDNITLSQVGDRLVFENGIITLTGYNYVEANKPTATIVDESGNPVSGVSLFPYLSSPYQIQLNMQEMDLSNVPARSRIVFHWPNVAETSGIAILLPGHSAPIASFTVDKISGNAPLTVQFTDTSSGDPTAWEWVFGDGSTSLEQNPSHTFITDKNYQVQFTASNALGQSTVIKTISVGAQLTADFNFNPKKGDAALLVKFQDTSKGGPTSWLWDFGDNETATEQNPEHLYMNPKPEGYQVTLTIQNETATSSKTATDLIKVMEKLEAQFTADKVSGKPPLTVKFTDQSKGGNSIVKWEWDFGDASAISNEKSPSHTYTTTGSFDVKLTVTRSDGTKDTEKKPGFINAYKSQMMLPFTQRTLLKDNSIYFTSFSDITGGTPIDTNIKTAAYTCAVNGMSATNGVISTGHSDADGMRVYLYPQGGSQTNEQTWWLIADFQNLKFPVFPKEKWKVNIVCLDNTMKGSVFLYNESFRNINGGTATKTGIATSSYFNCGITGVGGFGATGFLYNVPFAIPLEAYLEPGAEEWIIHSDMDVANGGDQWYIPVLCLKTGTYMNVEKPPFVTKQIFLQTSISTQTSTGISAADYLCGVNGYKSERGDIYSIYPLDLFNPANIANKVISMNAYQNSGYWWVEADLASRYKAEDWTVNVLCVKRGIGVEGKPPN
ncbi:MAG: PKD domain-containing protein [Anaerolineaceae bacterium]